MTEAPTMPTSPSGGPAGALTALGPGRWHLRGGDETWLPSLVHHGSASAPGETLLAVVREHPQHDGVLISGTAQELLGGAAALLVELAELVRKVRHQKRDDSAFTAPNYRVANMVRRALLTRPPAFAVTEVAFGAGVASIEYEPMAAHRLGQLGFAAPAAALARTHECPIVVPAGEAAMSSHLQLPPDIKLAPGCGRVPLGLRAKAVAEAEEEAAEKEAAGGAAAASSSTGAPVAQQKQRLLGMATLCASNVHSGRHAKYQTVAMSAYEPEVRLVGPPPEAKAVLYAAGYALRIGNVVAAVSPQITSVRRERILQLLPGVVIEDPPRSIRLDFDPMAHRSKRAALLVALGQVSDEVSDFAAAVERHGH